MSTSFTFTPLLGNPTKWGQKNVETVDLYGPDYYFSGGDPFPASDFGWGGFEQVMGGISQSGTYYVMGQFTGSGARTEVDLLFFTTTTGSEVAYGLDLSSEIFRVTFVGV